MTTAFLVLAIGLLQNAAPEGAKPPAPPAPAHVSNSFHFLIHAPMAEAAPLFGPNGERAWAGKHWVPEFLYPQPATDVQGAVFTVQHGPHTSLWVNTVFNLAEGRMQYVSFIPGVVVSTIDVRLTASDASTTNVDVTYVRTALDTSANDDVEELGRSDRESGPHWEQAIEAWLKQHRGQTR